MPCLCLVCLFYVIYIYIFMLNIHVYITIKFIQSFTGKSLLNNEGEPWIKK